jgi:small subunit ribosomal protein S20
MPQSKSTKKTLRQSQKKRIENLLKKRKMKKLSKKVEVLLSQKKSGKAKELLPQIYKEIDKAAKVGLIKDNTAKRRKSRITKLINKNK